jgi:RNA polymerase sigma factor (TIGR02999 family)
MRRILVDLARTRRSEKRGCRATRVSLEEALVVSKESTQDLLTLEDALPALASVHPRKSQVVELRFFGGFTVEETAEALGVTTRTVINDWNTARAWLRHELLRQRTQ